MPPLPASRTAKVLRELLVQLSEPESCPLDALVQDYLRAQRLTVGPRHHKLTRARLEGLVQSLRRIADSEGRVLVDVLDLDSNTAVRYIGERLKAGRAPATVRTEFVALRAMFAWAMREERIEVEPLKALRLPPSGRAWQRKPRARFTPDELRRLIVAARELDTIDMGRRRMKIPQAPLLEVAVWTGMRQGEQLKLTWGDYDRLGATLRLRAETTKSRRQRFSALRTEAVDALEYLKPFHSAWLRRAVHPGDLIFRGPQPRAEDRPLHGTPVWTWFRRVMLRAGLGVRDGEGNIRCWHSLRHALGDLMAAINVRAAQQQLGHASIRTTEGYLHRNDALVRETLEAIPGLEIVAERVSLPRPNKVAVEDSTNVLGPEDEGWSG